MFTIGERINGMFKQVGEAMINRDKKFIQDLALKQVNAGADALDISLGPKIKDGAEDAMVWAVQTIQEVTDKPLAIDTTRAKVMEAALSNAKNKTIINSAMATKEKLDVYIPMAVKYNASVIGLTMTEKGIPTDLSGRTEAAMQIIASAMEGGLSTDEIYIDPIILPVNVTQETPKNVMEVIKECKLMADPAPKTIVGLSNVSQGTSERELINRIFLVMAISYGLDAAILDVNDNALMDAMITAELLLNKNIYCDSFLQAYRKK